ncbi:MAG TPA: M17 family peptidase N-terminal domain-containing protein, partial [Candidatus Deferrimicrobium sp.]|nr:M17 family peptidase N-terminal domain-containing protein [Candidatus Deferrimicrobium sp.]
MSVAMGAVGDPRTIGGDALVVTAFKQELGSAATALDVTMSGELSALLSSGEMKGRFGEVVVLPAAAGIAARRVVVLGLGDRSVLDSFRLHNA